jgi:hypothetical protein
MLKLMTMDVLLKKLKDVVSEGCVTLILNTHRTWPDNERDPLVLKNLMKEAEERLFALYDKGMAQNLVARIRSVADRIDHQHHLESLVLFVNDALAEYVRLPVAVEDRVVIDRTFATRDLVRALHVQTPYFILVLSQQKVRLIEAFNDRVVAEVGKGFPMENQQGSPSNGAQRSNASRQTSLMAEFFNRVDKQVNQVRSEQPLPVLLCTEESNYHEYLKIADQGRSIWPIFLNGNRLDEKDHAIVGEAWNVVKTFMAQKNEARKEELQKAMGQHRFLADTNDIWRAIQQGRVQTLFIEEGNFKAARIQDDTIIYMEEGLRDQEGVIDDIYDELIEANLAHGGDVVFLPKGQLAECNGFGAITRY